MPGRELRAQIVLAGRTDASLKGIEQWLNDTSGKLTKFGLQMGLLSVPLVKFGKESLKQFMSFDDMMREIQAVGELPGKQLDAIEKAVREIGQTSKFTAHDAAEAALLLTQVGLGYKDVIGMLPEVLEMAQAGNLSIGDSADYLYSTLKSMGKGIEYSDTLVDQMAKTAALGATDIDTLGESLTRMGSGLQLYKGGSSEVLAILSGISQFGDDMRGSEAGTQLRNFMMSLAAPSMGKEETVAMLESIGMSMEEFEEVMDGVELGGASAAIRDMGLEVYNSRGELNSAIDIIGGLVNAVSLMDEETRNKTLGKIFGKRTMTTALNLMKAYEEILEQQTLIENSEGFAAQMAATMEGGLGGSVRTLTSQFNELKIAVGEALEMRAEGVIDWVGDFVTWVNSLDEDTKQRWADFGLILAGIGPAALGIASGMKFASFIIGAVSSPAGALITGALAIKLIADEIQRVREASLKDAFGDISLDADTMQQYLAGLRTEFTATLTDIGEYKTKLDSAKAEYETAARELSGLMYSSLVTDAELNETDIETLKALGETMIDSVLAGISAREGAANKHLLALFKDVEDPDALDALSGLLDANSGYFSDLRARFAREGQALRDALTEALRDRSLDGNEREAIIASMRRLNEIEAEIADYSNRVELKKLLRKGQSMGLQGIWDFAKELEEHRDKQLAEIDEPYEDLRARMEVDYDYKIENAANESERAALIEKRDRELAVSDRQQEKKRQEIRDMHDRPVATMIDAGMKDNGLGDAYRQLLEVASGERDAADYEYLDDLRDLVDTLEPLMPAMDGKNDELSRLIKGAFGLIDEVYQESMKPVGMIERVLAGAETDGSTSSFQTDASPIETAIEALDGSQIEADVGASTDRAEADIDALDGSGVSVVINPDMSQVHSALSNLQANVRLNPTGNIGPGGGMNTKALYAEGGRADEPSIFGEAGPEWAIPENHDQRTADLLYQAAKASGFTWDELAGSTGGLNAQTNVKQYNISYAPVIHAQDARGVEEVLRADKKRLDKWWADKQREQELLEAARAY